MGPHEMPLGSDEFGVMNEFGCLDDVWLLEAPPGRPKTFAPTMTA